MNWFFITVDQILFKKGSQIVSQISQIFYIKII